MFKSYLNMKIQARSWPFYLQTSLVVDRVKTHNNTNKTHTTFLPRRVIALVELHCLCVRINRATKTHFRNAPEIYRQQLIGFTSIYRCIVYKVLTLLAITKVKLLVITVYMFTTVYSNRYAIRALPNWQAHSLYGRLSTNYNHLHTKFHKSNANAFSLSLSLQLFSCSPLPFSAPCPKSIPWKRFPHAVVFNYLFHNLNKFHYDFGFCHMFSIQCCETKQKRRAG